MKKVGLTVVTYKDNFGSMLQTYATQHAVQKLGYDTRIFRIEGVHKQINARKVLFYIQRLFQPDEFKYLLDNLKSRTRKKVNSASDAYAVNMQIRHQVYKGFADQYLEMFPIARGWKSLRKQSEQCDAVVVGSDQLWRPSNIAGGYYTLQFVPDRINKVAYATSFGVSILPNSQKRTAKRFLSRIEHISVRENSGQGIVKKLIDRNIPVVCDPTMLLDADEWMSIQQEEPIALGSYILCYFLGDNVQHREFAKKLKEKTGARIIGLLHGATYISSDDDFVDEAPYDVGPAEFINLVRNAAYVCTDSFHCVVFSILNSKNFFVFRRYDDNSPFSTNDRLHTLLNWTGLKDRMLVGNECIEDISATDIDYTGVLQLVDEKRKESMAYLRDSLQN